MPGILSVSAEQAVYRKVCIEFLRGLFDTLPKKDRDILGKTCGVFRIPGGNFERDRDVSHDEESAVERQRTVPSRS